VCACPGSLVDPLKEYTSAVLCAAEKNPPRFLHERAIAGENRRDAAPRVGQQGQTSAGSCLAVKLLRFLLSPEGQDIVPRRGQDSPRDARAVQQGRRAIDGS